ncbi:hypothetical protein [Streptomyces sp. NPDC058595]|uniref:hypothetical protein n=1 Tax=Streptomyces sp. NPDC058595 TaxID=3346550 RepID=UPI003665B980
MRSGLLTLRAAGLVAAMVAVPVLGTTAADAHDSVKATVTPSPVRPGGEVKIKVSGCEDSGAGAARSDVFVADSELGARRGGDDRKPPLEGEAKVKSSAKDGRYAVDVWCDGHEHRRAAVFEVDRDPKPKPKPKPSAKTSASASAKPRPKAKPNPETSGSAPVSAKPKPKPKGSAAASAKPSANPESKPESKTEPARTGRQPRSSPPQSHAAPGDHRASPVAPVRAGGGGRTVGTAADEAGPSTPHTVIGLVLAGVAAVAVAIRSARRKRSAARDSD